ncbi:hypothetical protein F5887DRAFT_926834 [Amanita rubescens]|nr:hypothetical protein F5887DRAFT_926834 [Amanita rubescens]
MYRTRSVSSNSAHKNTSHHLCLRVVQEVLRTVCDSGATNVRTDTVQDLLVVLERAIAMISLDGNALRCQFCLLAPEITLIADRIQRKCNSMVKNHVHLSLHQLHVESMEDLLNDYHILKELLQSIAENKPTKPRTRSSPSILNEAHDLRFDGAKFTNVAGDSTVDTSSNFILVIKISSLLSSSLFEGVLGKGNCRGWGVAVAPFNHLYGA